MKSRIMIIALCVAGFACKDDEVFTETPPVPGDVFNVELCPTLLSNVISLFPESKNNQETHSQLFSNGSQQKVVLTKDSDVFVTFVTEAATIGNVLGYYIYSNGSTPGSADNIDKQLIFPNVDKTLLSPGDTRRLGTEKLKAGTVIAFFLIVGGYREDGVYFKRPTFYTDANLNKDAAKQHVMYRENECGAIVVGFEDKTSATADKDFNDVIFTVSDNVDNIESSSFDIQNVVTLSK